MNLRHIEIFCTVVECESFSGAAEKLIMTQPAVSMQVQAVERHFGVQLLERRRGRTVVTEAGRVVYRWAQSVLHSEAETRREIQEMAQTESGRVVVGASMTVGSYVLPRILGRFKRLEPDAEIVVRLGERDEICGEILAGTIDCGVLIAHDQIPGLDQETLGFEEIMFICAPTHRLANADRVMPADISKEPFIMSPRGSSYRKIIDAVLEREGLVGLSVVMEFDGAEGVKRGVQQGLGLGLGLRSGVEWEIEHGMLREVHVLPQRPRVPLALVYHPRRGPSSIRQTFTAFLRSELRDHLGGCDPDPVGRDDADAQRPGQPAAAAS